MDERENMARRPQETPRGAGLRREIYDWAQCIVSALVVCILIFAFAVRLIGVQGISMQPTLHNGDRLLISDLFYTPKQGDIVVLQTDSFSGEAIIKRVIATEGQVVDIDFETGVVYVDGEALSEPYTAEPTYVQLDFSGPVEVPEGCVFVMGDNRNRSNDSRDARIGMIDTREILGRVLVRILPLSQIGTVD